MIEVIITIVLVAVFAAFLVSFTGTGVTRSSQVFTWLQTDLQLSDVAEQITLEYREAMEAGTSLATFAAGLSAKYGSVVDSVAETDFVEQTGGDYAESGTNSIFRKVVLRSGDQRLVILFTE